MLQTPEANLSRAVQWLNVSYGVWFNRRHDRAGHLFQGRFKAVVVEADAGWQELARYVHLNPVRVEALKLGKRQRAADRVGLSAAPPPALLAERLRRLRSYRWSSYRAYAGYCAVPVWLQYEPIGRLCGGRSRQQQQQALREYTERAVRQGALEPPWSRLIGGLVLGSEAFARALSQRVRGNPHEQTELRQLAPRIGWEQILKSLEELKGQKWKEFWQTYGDWGRDAALWLGRKRGRLTLGQLGDLAGGVEYAAVAQAVSRFGQRLERERGLRETMAKLERQLSKV